MEDRYYKVGRYCQIKNLSDILIEHIGYKEDGTFVEVGAFDCYQWSNTYGLAMMGWRGLYFEPQIDEYNKCNELHGNRDKVEVVRLALSDWSGETDLYLGGSISTISREQKDIYLSLHGWSSVTGLADGKTERVSVSTLSKELDAREWPKAYDLLVVDVEGSEVSVIKEGGLEKHRPHMIIIETHEESKEEKLSGKATTIYEMLSDAGYSKMQSDTINSIYVDYNLLVS